VSGLSSIVAKAQLEGMNNAGPRSRRGRDTRDDENDDNDDNENDENDENEGAANGLDLEEEGDDEDEESTRRPDL
jgi:hypothetical protein